MKALEIAFAQNVDPDGSLLEFRLFDTHGQSRTVQGNAAVEQNFIKVLLTTPGTNIFDPTQGGGLLPLVGQSIDDRDFQTKQMEIAQAIIRAEQQIQTSQNGIVLPASERLTQAEILEITFDTDQQTWTVRIALHMDDGNVLRVLLPH